MVNWILFATFYLRNLIDSETCLMKNHKPMIHLFLINKPKSPKRLIQLKQV